MAISKAKREKKQLAIGIRQLAKSKPKREQAIHGTPGPSAGHRPQERTRKKKQEKQQSALSSQHSVKEKTKPKKNQKKQSGFSIQKSGDPESKAQEKTKQSIKPHTFTLPRRQVFNFPQAKGRVVREIEFSIDSSYKCLEFRFQDNTTLSFEFEPSFIWEAYFARWKSGEQSILHRWPLRNG